MSKEQNLEMVVRKILIESTQIKYYDRELYIDLGELSVFLKKDRKDFLTTLSELRRHMNENK